MIDHSRLHGARQITDAHLLAPATANDGHFVTFDRAVPLTAAVGATETTLTVL